MRQHRTQRETHLFATEDEDKMEDIIRHASSRLITCNHANLVASLLMLESPPLVWDDSSTASRDA
jgi:hypothetical protein